MAAAATSQTANETSAESRQQCVELLGKARQALKSGDLEAADSWLEKAEAMKVPFKRMSFGETPDKVRADLEKARAEDSAPDPRTERLPAASPEEQGGDRAACDRLLVEARKALAVGDVREASDLASRAKDMAVEYGAAEDSPMKVEAAIRRWNSLNSADAATKERESHRRQHAQCLMEQAEALAAWNEFDEAERLCNDASRLGAKFNPLESDPTAVRKRIAAARTGRHSQAERLPAVGADSGAKDQALALVRDARKALEAGDLRRAEKLANDAEDLGVPDEAFAPRDDRPWHVLRDLQNRRDRGVRQAGGEAEGPRYGGVRALYEPDRDTTRNERVSSSDEEVEGVAEGMDLYLRGEEAFRAGDREQAIALFRGAYQRKDELDPRALQRVQQRLSALDRTGGDVRRTGGQQPSELPASDADADVRMRKASMELARQENAARNLEEVDPKGALQVLQSARARVEQAELEPEQREQLVRRVSRSIGELEAFIAANKPQIELTEKNRQTQEEIDRERKLKLDVQQRLAYLVDQFNQLVDEERFAEAEVVAKQAAELAPNEPIVVQLRNQSKVLRRIQINNDINDRKEEGYASTMTSVERSSVPFDDGNPIQWGSIDDWSRLTDSRKRFLDPQNGRRSPRELEIERLLKTPVSAQYENAPLTMVIQDLCKMAGINVFFDEAAMRQEGITSETAVNLSEVNDIRLESALNLILEQHGLTYVIKNEVLKITSEAMRDGEVYPVTYYVADLVTPIPNFVPNGNMGLAGALTDATNRMSMNWNSGLGAGASFASLAGNEPPKVGGNANPNVMAQVNSPNLTPMLGGAGASGPGGAGGGVQPDFDSLIELITNTIEPESWDEAGGAGAIQEFAGNLSLVISQTQSVHEEVAALLQQLRRLQDLQVTIEVRFITLNDNFFERIGIDFDFDVNDNTDKPFQIFGNPIGNPQATTTSPPNTGPNRNTIDRDLRPGESVTVGLQAPNVFSADLDIPFRQENFSLAVPQFGGFQPGAGATMGFAILSDLEAYFFMEASQGDRRSNVLQAPKVTLFNGQTASVFDVSQSPFVISLIPVVGDFAAANMPVIVVLNEGSHLTVQAVVSPDRRFVRLTVVPFFSKITDVNTFRFTGSDSTTEDSEDEGADDKTAKKKRTKTSSSEGTTVQLPTFSFVTVATTVSVPDGGTVLLGGIKRLSEGRNEFGVPLLNKIPYLNRLFRNVGIGRETQSLMMMVTPRIIIQEEEEDKLLNTGAAAP